MKRIAILLFTIAISAYCSAQEYFKEYGALRIMTYNIRNAKGMDMKTDYERIANIIKSVNPDIVAIQELDSVTNRSNGVDVLAKLASLTNMYGTYGAAIDFDGGKYGVGILSKISPTSVKNIALPGREEQRTVLVADFTDYVFACTHWSLTAEDRVSSVAIVNKIADQFSTPFILAGDFNMTPDSDEFQRLSENWKVLNNIKKKTFPSDKPDRCIDFIFYNTKRAWIENELNTKTLIEKMASDHRPIFVDIKLFSIPAKIITN